VFLSLTLQFDALVAFQCVLLFRYKLTEFQMFGNSGGHIRLYRSMELLIVLQILFVSFGSHLLTSG
jgi:hypothetical protein